MRSLAVSLLLAAACGGSGTSQSSPATPPPAPAEAPANPDAPELEILERFQTLGDYVSKSGGQCARLATGLETWMDGNGGEVAALIDRSRAEPGLESGHLARVEERLERVFAQVLAAVDACGT